MDGPDLDLKGLAFAIRTVDVAPDRVAFIVA